LSQFWRTQERSKCVAKGHDELDGTIRIGYKTERYDFREDQRTLSGYSRVAMQAIKARGSGHSSWNWPYDILGIRPLLVDKLNNYMILRNRSPVTPYR
jgi:hypothetical protein